jgi:hypothetical protein
MAKLTLNTIVAGYKATTALNSNSAATVAAMEKTLSLDGTAPNAMTADLDMNGNSILNSANALGAVTSVSATAPITKSGTTTPTIGISASTGSAAGSMSAADKTKLDAVSGTNTGDQTTVSGNAGTVTTNANLTGHVTSSGNAAVLGSFTSADLKTALTNETGSGVAVFATSPTFITPVLGTPASGNLANCTFPTLNQATTGNADTATLAANVTTNANLTGHITSTGNAAVLGSFTSAQLASALTNETGSGAAVFGTSPTMASPTMTGTVTVPTPSNNTDAATKAYVDTIKQGSIDIKDSVRVASTANIAIGSALVNSSTIDGVTVATGNRVLLKDQSDASENGIYAVVGSGAASRTLDANTSALVTNGMYTFVSEGSVSNATGYVLTTVDTINLDTTNLTFTQFSGAGQIDAGTGLTKTGNTLNVIGTANRIVANANTVDIGSDVALVANPLSQFAATSSAQLKGVLSDETGSGVAVFATSPTLVTPVLGTPTSGVVTNLTGTASININGTVGAGTPATAAVTTLTATGDITMTGKAINQAVHTEAAHATTSDIWAGGNTCLLSGSVVTFTDIADAPQAGAIRYVVSNAAHVFTDNSALEVDGNESYTCAANDVLMITAKTTSTFRVSVIAHGDNATGGGGGGDSGLNPNSATVADDYTLANGYNAISAGPITIATGKTVTIPTASRWVIV